MPAWPIQFTANRAPIGTETIFTQGKLAGGGYSTELSLSDDGATVMTRSDTYQANILNRSTGEWENIFNSNRFPITWVQGGGTHGIAVAPSDSTRVYICCGSDTETLGTGYRPVSASAVWRSNDSGQTFQMTAMTEIAGDQGGNRIQSPKILVDPNNADIVYIANQAGIVWVSYNGGDNWSMITDLLDAIPSTTVAAVTNTGGAYVYVNHVAELEEIATIIGGGISTYLYNFDNPGSNGISAIGSNISGITQNTPTPGITQLFMAGGWAQDDNTIGDTIYFSGGATFAIDKMGGTVTNPGIALGHTGASGVASSVVYVGFNWFASGIWRSTDGGVNFSIMSGSPTMASHMKISRDATGGVLYLSDFSGATPEGNNTQRYVPATPPAGSGLTGNTWTNLSVHSGNWVACALPDPATPGKVAFIAGSDNLAMSDDWGITSNGVMTTVADPEVGPGGEPTWLAATDDPFGQNFGDAFWDPVVPGRLYHCNGIGIWYTDSPYDNPTVWVSHTRGLDSMTTQSIVKAPAPNGRLFVAVQDRSFFTLEDTDTYPDVDHPFHDAGGGGITQAGTLCHSYSDPTVVFGSRGGEIWRTQDSGDNWHKIGSFGVNGYSIGNGKACLASLTPTTCLQAPTPGGGVIQIGTASGDPTVTANWTWTSSLYSGSTMPANGTFGYGTNARYINHDHSGGNYFVYYPAFLGPGSPANNKIYKSADGGFTFTLLSTPTAEGNDLDFLSGAQQPVYTVMPGFPNIHFYSPGSGFSPSNIFNANTSLRISLDAGVTWQSVTSTHLCAQVAFGKHHPGNAYPAIFFTGTTLPYPAPWNVFRCDDFNGSATMSWVTLDNIKETMCEISRCLDGDMDEYGTVYVGTGSSGYLVGRLG